MGVKRRCVEYQIVEAPVCVDWEVKNGKRRCVRKEVRKVRRCKRYEPI